MRRPVDTPRSPLRGRPAIRVVHLVTALAGVGAASCGASIQAMYEGNVRFEHCMALDARPDVKPTIRRACWEEWAQWFTYGQTRDRIEYAHLRERQLSTASDFDEADWNPVKAAPQIAAPDPTSAAAPPPMLLATDGGAPAAVDDPAAHGDCAANCQQTFDACRQGCKTQACERTCSARYKKCAKRCN